jgi:predicted RNase H-like HicB family nuclease
LRNSSNPPSSVVETPLTGPASILNPAVSKSGAAYTCELRALIGKGVTPEAAVADWNECLRKHLATAGEDDEIVKMVKALLEPPIDELHAKYGLHPVNKSKRRI